MKYRIFILTIAIAVFLPMLFGCMKEDMGDDLQQPVPIILGINELDASSTKSSGPVDKWEFTPVSVAYLFEPSTVFDKSMNIIVKYNETTEHINTGLAYPIDNSDVSFIGYHPVAKPNALGTVTYDLSKGDVDAMMSNTVTGSKSNRIYEENGNNRKLIFKHLLTRVTFKMECVKDQSYSETVYGIRASAASTKIPLNTALTIDLATRNLVFNVAGEVFSGDLDGFDIPPSENPRVLDIMLQPDVPLQFTVLCLTGEKEITIDSDTNSLWNKLITEGGDKGVQYTVLLRFSGQAIVAFEIAITPWETETQNTQM